jgi:Domain of unknown function (DUF1905)
MDYQFKSTLGHKTIDSLGWNFRIVVPDDVMDHFKSGDKRVICTINDSAQLHCALMSNGDGTYFIMTNANFRKVNKLNEGDEVFVKLKVDDSKYGMYVPDFFEELCFQDPEADVLFHKLTAGKQRTLLHIISKLKSEEKQLEKSLIIFDYLKSVNGKIDFKELNEAFKTSRFKK